MIGLIFAAAVKKIAIKALQSIHTKFKLAHDEVLRKKG